MFDQVLTFCVYILLCESFKMNDLVCSMDRPPHTDGVLTVTQVHFGSCTDDLDPFNTFLKNGSKI